nr:helix-turn-helix transcriptional regulator [Bifidobacterium sp. DSM 109963]
MRLFEKWNKGGGVSDFSATITSVRQLAVSLRDARQNAGLSQTELAQAANLPRPWINQLEQGKITDPGIHRLLSICNALHTTLTIAYPVQPQEQTQEQTQTAKPSRAVSANTETSKQPDATQEAACSPGDSTVENFTLSKVDQSLLEDLTRMAAAFDEQAAALNGKSRDKKEAQ